MDRKYIQLNNFNLNNKNSHSSLILPILKKFAKKGIKKADEILRKELLKKVENGDIIEIHNLIIQGYLKFLHKNVLEKLIFFHDSKLTVNLNFVLQEMNSYNEGIAFPILRDLSDYGTLIAKLMIKEQIMKTGLERIWLNF